MGWATALAIYFVIWWLMLFVVLPFGLRTQEEDGEVLPGSPESAPVHPHIVRTLVATTVLSCAIFALVYFALTRDWLGVDAQFLQIERYR